MSSNAQRYAARSPRYVFRPADQSYLRYAGMETRGISNHAAIRDISESGLLFTLGNATPPEEGEMLKLEFHVPGRKQIACFGTVVRVETRTEWDPEWGERAKTLVALQFRHLPTMHRRAIQMGLSGLVDKEEEDRWELARRKQVVLFGALTCALGAALFVMTQPFEAWLHPFWF